jgi:hypothetical protein
MRIKTLYILAFLLFIAPFVSGQNNSDSIIFKAMKDELNRSMQKLTIKDYANPFYISYTIEDVKTMFISSTLGALGSTSERHYRSWSNRVLAGNYKLNDENYVDATRRKPQRDGDLELPLDNDYYGIRRALWMMTNNTYKSAAENYKNKLAALKDKNLTTKDLQIDDFSSAPRIDTVIGENKLIWDKKMLENLAKKTSAIFVNYPEIFYSEVTMFQLHANLFFCSSEQSKFKEPLNILYITVSAIGQADNGESISEQLCYTLNSPSELPSADSLVNQSNNMAKLIIEKSKAPMLDENYSGPVLFMGQSVANILSLGLFNGPDNLYAYREPLYNNSQMSMTYGQNLNSLESKIDKLVVAKSISINDYSKLKEYNGIKLIGSYSVDGEGVRPPDILNLIENGILKNLYNGRTPTRSIKESNGHRRYVYQSGGVTSDLGPGVIFISSNESKSESELQENLIKEAKDEGLDYALEIKPLQEGDFDSPLSIYKINVADGKEQLLRDATMGQITINSLKKIVGVSNKNMVYNTLLNTGDGVNLFSSEDALPSGAPVSFIMPNSMLIKDVEFQRQTKPLATDKPIVKNPLEP